MNGPQKMIPILAAMLLSLPLAAPGYATSVAEGTIKRVDEAAKKIVVSTKDGTESTFAIVDRTAMHGFKDAGKGSKKLLSGTLKGNQVIVHYTTAAGVDTAEEIDKVGHGGLKQVNGTVAGIDRGAKTITLTTADGGRLTFVLLEQPAYEPGTDIPVASDSAKVMLYYSDEDGKNVAHLVKILP